MKTNNMKEKQEGSPTQFDLMTEGECKINKITPLKLKYFKATFVIILSILMVVPAIVFLNFKRVRKIFIYSRSDFHQATHIFIESKHDGNDLVRIQKNQNLNIFTFNKLKYQIIGDSFVPLVLSLSKQLEQLNSSSHRKSGLSFEEVKNRIKKYGKNTHDVDIQNYFAYIFGVIFQPIYISHYLVILSLSIQGLVMFGCMLVVGSLVSASINYVVLYLNKKKIKKAVQKNTIVRVVRNNTLGEIPSQEIVPGDVFILTPGADIRCDALLLEGSVFMNENSLTGQNIPIKKTVYRERNYNASQSWIYDGTKVIEANVGKAIAIYTGFATKKGRMLRKILYRIPSQPDIFDKIMIFLFLSFIVGTIMYVVTLPIRLHADISRVIVAVKLIDYWVASAPPAIPIYFTIAYSWSLYRLQKLGIICTVPETSVQANRLKIVCFDKTGTLTSNFFSIHSIYGIQQNQIKEIFIDNKKEYFVNLIKIIFGCCHSIIKVDDIQTGDQIDLKMWEKSNFQFSNEKQLILTDQKGKKFQVLHINQFQSRFQSMSVIIKQVQTGQYFIFAKGAPEKMVSNALQKIPQFMEFNNQMSLKGLRTIAFGHKKIDEKDVDKFIKQDRQMMLKDIQINGIICFTNSLSDKVEQTIQILHDCQINTKIITGDSLFVAVEIAYQAKILSPTSSIFLIQGQKFKLQNHQKIYDVLEIRNQIGDRSIIQRNYSMRQMLQLDGEIGVDNDFVTDQSFQLYQHIKIFSRILPQNKAKIVKTIRKNLEDERKDQKWYRKCFKECRDKVGMVGDGANDLMAIKEADVGIGLCATDAVLSSSFVINDLQKLISIIKQGKCTTLNILQLLRFTMICNYVIRTSQVLLATQATFFSDSQNIYISFFIILILPIMSVSGPAKKLQAKRVKDNYMNWSNQLGTWGTIIIWNSTLIICYYFLTLSSEYIPNPNPKWDIITGFNYECQLVTVVFLVQCVIICCTEWIVYQGSPFKEPIYHNRVLAIGLFVNFVAFTVYFFIIDPSGLKFLDLVPMAKQKMLVIYLISMCGILMAYALNWFICYYTIKQISQNKKYGVNQQISSQVNNQIKYQNQKVSLLDDA